MSRIRSVHPGQWTDEHFVGCSPLARLLAIGIRNEADDNGVFEWKPVTIKMKLFANDNCDVSALLDELATSGQVSRFEAEGRSYGAIRNFRKFQRPEKPKSWHPFPDSLREYVGLSPITPRPDADRSATDHRNVSQMEEEGGRRKDEEEKKDDAPDLIEPVAPAARPSKYAFEGEVIRLTPKHFEKWRSVYTGITDLPAELTALDDWLVGQPEKSRKGWFHLVSGALKKKHNAIAVLGMAAKPGGLMGRDF